MRILILLLSIVFLSASCGRQQDAQPETDSSTDIIFQSEIVVSVEDSEVIANPTRIASYDDGFILFDSALNKVMIFSGNGELRYSFGRQGRGPGEFRNVSSVSYHNGRIVINDSELLRHTVFMFDGELEYNHNLSASLFAFNTATAAPGRFITPTNGSEGGLAKLVDRIGNTELVLGTPVTEAPEVADFNQWQRELASGRVPDFFRNTVAVSADESYIYLFLQTEGILQQFSWDGELNWEKTIELPEFEKAFERFVENNKDNPPGRVFMLQYVDAIAQNENGVYMLLNTSGETLPTVLRVDHAGENRHLYRFEGMQHRPSQFSITPNRENAWFLNVSDGVVYQSLLSE